MPSRGRFNLRRPGAGARRRPQPLSRHSRRRQTWPRGAAIVRRRAGDAEAHRRREVVRAQGGRRLLARRAGRRRHPPVRRREPPVEPGDAVHAAPATVEARRPSQCRARRLRRADRQRQARLRRRLRGDGGLEEDAIAKRFALANDDYSSILTKALADRFAEALAEALHARCAANSGATRPTRRCRRTN